MALTCKKCEGPGMACNCVDDELGCQRCGEDSTHIMSIQAKSSDICIFEHGEQRTIYPEWMRYDYEGNMVCGVLVCTACGQVQGDSFPANPY